MNFRIFKGFCLTPELSYSKFFAYPSGESCVQMQYLSASIYVKYFILKKLSVYVGYSRTFLDFCDTLKFKVAANPSYSYSRIGNAKRPLDRFQRMH